MRWDRITLITATAILGLSGFWIIITNPTLPRWLIAFSGLLGLSGLCSLAVLCVLILSFIVEDVRPRIRFRKPVVPLALSHREAALVGRRAYRNHPITFWGGLILNNRFFIGFMFFGKPEHEAFQVEHPSGE